MVSACSLLYDSESLEAKYKNKSGSEKRNHAVPNALQLVNDNSHGIFDRLELVKGCLEAGA